MPCERIARPQCERSRVPKGTPSKPVQGRHSLHHIRTLQECNTSTSDIRDSWRVMASATKTPCHSYLCSDSVVPAAYSKLTQKPFPLNSFDTYLLLYRYDIYRHCASARNSTGAGLKTHSLIGPGDQGNGFFLHGKLLVVLRCRALKPLPMSVRRLRQGAITRQWKISGMP